MIRTRFIVVATGSPTALFSSLARHFWYRTSYLVLTDRIPMKIRRLLGRRAGILRDLANPAHRAEVAALWGIPSVPEKPGKTAVEMFQAAADGEIRALWIACTNPN